MAEYAKTTTLELKHVFNNCNVCITALDYIHKSNSKFYYDPEKWKGIPGYQDFCIVRNIQCSYAAS